MKQLPQDISSFRKTATSSHGGAGPRSRNADHNVVREGVTSILNRAGDMVVVTEAKDGIEAIDRFQEFHPDVSVTDRTGAVVRAIQRGIIRV